MVTLRETITKLVKDFDIKGDNDSGQNFLVDENVLEIEINEAHLVSEDTILDIGAGFGSIETKASKKCHVIAIERDIKCYSYLIDKYEINANIQIVNADALNMIYPEFTKIVSNPPYNIADRIIEKISHYNFADSIMILPKTMADELCSIQSHTSFSAINKLFMEFYKIMEVERTSFFPEPRVTSVMVRIKKKENNILQDTFRRTYGFE
jgi:16S rRNA (adenine1518-N6/adenine1519-N6)-dimethyltransferase